ncbi:MAG: 4-oxalocrotonate tautomerase [Pseudonocardiales bacterium]|jgi:4-oxalocrotonate tautomerase|nr:4-oxalocrotonate tautomerase [Pseudonocardiales bacterium]
MPIVHIEVAQGRDAETLRKGLQAVHEAVRDSFGVRDEQIRVLVTEVPPQFWSAGGKTLLERELER